MGAQRRAFVSGHTDLSQDDFDAFYVSKIRTALDNGDHLLLGDATGVDTQALDFLLSPDTIKQYPNVKQQITIYASREDHVSKLKKLGVDIIGPKDPSLKPTDEIRDSVGFKNEGKDKLRFKYSLHDAYLTLNSDYDILHARTEQESRDFYGTKYRDRLSATEMNRRRRLILQAKAEGRPPPEFEISDVKSGKYVLAKEEDSQELMSELPGSWATG